MHEQQPVSRTRFIALTWDSNRSAEIAAAFASKFSCRAPLVQGLREFEVNLAHDHEDDPGRARHGRHDDHDHEGHSHPRFEYEAGEAALMNVLGIQGGLRLNRQAFEDPPTCVLVGNVYKLCHNHSFSVGGVASEVTIGSGGNQETVEVSAYFCSVVPSCNAGQNSLPQTWIA